MKEQFDNYQKVRERLLTQRAVKDLDGWAQEVIAKLHSEIFSHTYHTPCKGCPKAWIGYMDDLERWYQGNIHIFGTPVVEPEEEVPVKKKGKPMSEASKQKMRDTIARKMEARKAADTKSK